MKVRTAEAWTREWCANECSCREPCRVKKARRFCSFARHQLRFVRRILKAGRKGKKRA